MSETDRADGYGNLAELWQRSSEAYSERQLFGVKEPDGWCWMTYGELAGDVDACRAALALSLIHI